MKESSKSAPELNLDIMMKTLASPVRRSILILLKEPSLNFQQNDKNIRNEEGVCVDSIAKTVGLAQSTVSAHLASLERAGFVSSVSFGKWTYFSRVESTISRLLTKLNADL